MDIKRFKGQVSLEYLMTYGIAIAIVVIAVAALYSMGVFSGSTTTAPPCSNCFSDFAYNARAWDADADILTIEMKNGPASMSYADCSADPGGASACSIVGNETESGTAVAAGSLFQVEINGDGSQDVKLTLQFKQSGSSLVQTRTQTISADYFD